MAAGMAKSTTPALPRGAAWRAALPACDDVTRERISRSRRRGGGPWRESLRLTAIIHEPFQDRSSVDVLPELDEVHDVTLDLTLAPVSGMLLLRRSPWGYLLASVFVMKTISMGLAVSVMAISMALAGVPDSLLIVIPFLLITLISLTMAILLLRSVDARQPALQAAG